MQLVQSSSKLQVKLEGTLQTRIETPSRSYALAS